MTKSYLKEIESYIPFNAQEERDQATMLELIAYEEKRSFSRECLWAHFSASSMILNKTRDKALMAFHNIYQSWAWTGGHMDEDTDFLYVAIKEAKEETGIQNIQLIKEGIVALDILPVQGHMKHGKYISPHVHYNVTYLFEADDQEEVAPKEDENSAVKWIDLKHLIQEVREPEMKEVYRKILRDYLD